MAPLLQPVSCDTHAMNQEASTRKWVVWGCCKVAFTARAGERGSNALTIGQLSAAQLGAV
eukprot:5058790-Prymnesium_polylepis.1